jgi:hypothetical protein
MLKHLSVFFWILLKAIVSHIGFCYGRNIRCVTAVAFRIVLTSIALTANLIAKAGA